MDVLKISLVNASKDVNESSKNWKMIFDMDRAGFNAHQLASIAVSESRTLNTPHVLFSTSLELS